MKSASGYQKMDQVQGFYLETQEFREARQATRAEYKQVNKLKEPKTAKRHVTPPGQIARRRVKRLGARDGWICKLCGQPVDPKILIGPWRGTSDHVKPRSEGGTYHLWNLQLAHAICNERRGNKPLDSDELE
jgi:5-methylcytosine-specific restriction endonuclease McrA